MNTEKEQAVNDKAVDDKAVDDKAVGYEVELDYSPRPFVPNDPRFDKEWLDGLVTPLPDDSRAYYQMTDDGTFVLVQPPTTKKKWWQSKTLWFNTIATGVGVATASTPLLEPMMTAENFGVFTAVVGIANIILRSITHQSIRQGGK